MRAFPPWIARAAFLVKLAVLAAAGSGAPNLPMCSGLLLGLLSISALGIRSRMPHRLVTGGGKGPQASPGVDGDGQRVPPLRRVLYPLEAAVDVLQAVCACSLFHALYPTVSGASPQRALSCMLVGNGVLALALRSQLSALPFKCVARGDVGAGRGHLHGVAGLDNHAAPACLRPARCTRPRTPRSAQRPPLQPSHLSRPCPQCTATRSCLCESIAGPSSLCFASSACRWRLPTLLATSAALLAHTASLCSSALLQHGFRTLHTLARTLLPVLCPAFIDLMPPDGPGALLAPAPPTSAEGAALCAAYQAPSVLLGCVALACHLCAAEAAARKAEQGAARSAH